MISRQVEAEQRHRMNERVAGVDLGKAWAKFVVASRAQDATLRIEESELLAHHGSPFTVFSDWYQRVGAAGFQVIAATGLHSPELGAPVVSDLPEEACLQAALSVRSDLSGPLNLVSLSARGYSVLTRDPQGRVRYLEKKVLLGHRRNGSQKRLAFWFVAWRSRRCGLRGAGCDPDHGALFGVCQERDDALWQPRPAGR